jgi:hypothetical protein
MSFSSEIYALVAFLIIIGAGAYICSLEHLTIALGEALDAANAANPHHARLTTLLGEHEALQGAFKTSENTIRRLRATNDALERKVASLENPRATSNPHHNVAAWQQTTTDLWRQLAAAKSRLENVQAACDDKSDEIRALLATADHSRAELVCLGNIVSAHATTIWQRALVVGKFNHFKELIHRLAAAGGCQMVVTVLFVAELALFGGVDLAELEIDHLRFETYYEYARAQAAGLLCPLLPQGKQPFGIPVLQRFMLTLLAGGFRLHGLQYSLSGLRVVGTRIVEPATTFFANVGPAPISSALTFFAPTLDPPSKALAPATPSAPLPLPPMSAPIAAPAPAPAAGFQASKAPGSFGLKGSAAQSSAGAVVAATKVRKSRWD